MWIVEVKCKSITLCKNFLVSSLLDILLYNVLVAVVVSSEH